VPDSLRAVRFLVLISVKGRVDPHSHSAAGRILSIEKSNYLIVNRHRDLPSCSLVPKLQGEQIRNRDENLLFYQTQNINDVLRLLTRTFLRVHTPVYMKKKNEYLWRATMNIRGCGRKSGLFALFYSYPVLVCKCRRRGMKTVNHTYHRVLNLFQTNISRTSLF
jgi:hypothetical protein